MLDPNQATGDGSPIGGQVTYSNGDSLVVINNRYNYDRSFDAPESLNMTSPTGTIQSYMRAAMQLLINALGIDFSYDLAGNEVAGNDQDVNVPAPALGSSDNAFPSNGDIVSGQYLYRPDSMDIDMYKFQVGAGGGDFSAETIAQRMANASPLNTELILFDAKGNVLARNDNYYNEDSFISLHLDEGTYFIGVSASGNDQYNPNVVGSGIGGTTEGPYQLRLNLQPTVTAQLVNAQSIPLDGDGDGDGQPGGQYNYWFNVEPASRTLFADKAATGTTADGTAGHPYKNISDATSAAAKNYAAGQTDIVRVVANNFANDNQGHGIVVDPAHLPTDGQTFSLSDGSVTYTFEFDSNGVWHSSNNRIQFKSSDSTATIVNDIYNAINKVSWIPDGLSALKPSRTAGGLDATPTVSGNTIYVDGPNVTISLGISNLQSTLQDNMAYEIGTATSGKALSDGSSLDVPKGVTVMFDAGAVVKLWGASIEVGMGSQLIAEGSADHPIIFTSFADDTYGAGGTFATNNNGNATTPSPEDWGGLYFAPTSQGSIDQAQIAYAGGQVSIEGTFTRFAPVDIRQATVRITNTTFHDNTAVAAAANDNRNGRGQIVEPGIIYVQFAQPVIANNVFVDNSKNRDGTTNAAAAISIDVNSLNSLSVPDWGRSTGPADVLSQYAGNFGPLVRGNELADNSVNGMLVRGGMLTTEGIWDDTDIVHVVHDQIVVPNLDTYGGLRLESSPTQSLVIKFSATNAGLTATGTLLEITDRVGGTVQVLGQPGHPVVLTSISDDTVGAGADPKTGKLVTDTNNDNYNSAPNPGDWQGITLDQYSNDSNVAVAVETEPATGSQDENSTVDTAQPLGALATTTQGGDDVLRLGFEVHGSIASDRANDSDVYSFQATAGTPVWIAVRSHEFLARFGGATDRRRRKRDRHFRQLAGGNRHGSHVGQQRLDLPGRL